MRKTDDRHETRIICVSFEETVLFSPSLTLLFPSSSSFFFLVFLLLSSSFLFSTIKESKGSLVYCFPRITFLFFLVWNPGKHSVVNSRCTARLFNHEENRALTDKSIFISFCCISWLSFKEKNERQTETSEGRIFQRIDGGRFQRFFKGLRICSVFCSK